MKPNRFGERFKITTFGESHSKAIGVLIQGVKPGIEINIEHIKKLLDERKPKKKLTTTRKENDELVILSGIFKGKTLGSPIVAIVYNKDARSKDYENLKDIFRPSHADFTFFKKYGIRDYRGGGRSSGRETVSRVIAGGIAEDFIKKAYNIEIVSKIVKIGPFKTDKWDDTSPELPFADKNKIKEIENFIKSLNGDSIGAIIETRIKNVPYGIGEPVFEKLEANLSKAVLSIGATKGIEFGDGFMFSDKKGSEVNDEMNRNGFVSNHSGGIQGGISNGETIIFRTAVKPTPSISKEQNTINVNNEEIKIKINGRHDPCIALRIIPVINSMVSVTLLDMIDEQNLIAPVNKKNRKPKNKLEELRRNIAFIDKNIFFHLNERFEIVKKISEYKKNNNMKIEDVGIERKLINKIIDIGFKNLKKNFIKDIYDLIFKESKRLQKSEKHKNNT